MPEYIVYLSTTAHTFVTVEAEDQGDAIDKIADAEMPELCAQCSGWETNLELSHAWETSGVILPDGSYADAR